MSLKLNIDNLENDKNISNDEEIKKNEQEISNYEESDEGESDEEETKESDEEESDEGEKKESDEEESDEEESDEGEKKESDEGEKKESDDEDTDEESDDEDFKKFEQDIKKDNLIYYHTNSKHISQEELITLCKIVKNKNGLIIDPLHTTLPYLTKFEKARVIGLRAKQINNGSEPFIDVPNNMIEGLTIAEKELEEKKIPFIIRRPLPNGTSEYWKLSDLEYL